MADTETFLAVLPSVLTDLEQDLTRKGMPKALTDRFLAVSLHTYCLLH